MMKGIDPHIFISELSLLYGEQAHSLAAGLSASLEKYRQEDPINSLRPLDQTDSVLITYPDQFSSSGTLPLDNLLAFCQTRLKGIVNGVHILPFYPWSSDDGFSVIDFRQVDPSYGSWEHIRTLAEDFRVMVDAVINHTSSQSLWFKGFLKGDSEYKDFYITKDKNTDLTAVVRPRTTPVLTEFHTKDNPVQVWTTFSADQVDLNYQNPSVLFEILSILLFYISQGASILRLDAIAYLWKDVHTSCIHLPQTHALIRILRKALDQVAPHVFLLTETNVPHVENLSYFGSGYDEAHMVYNFALPPLVLHGMINQDAGYLSEWAATLSVPSNQTTFFNFLASHDGIGINPVRGILPPAEINSLVREVMERGGLVSSRSNPDGGQDPYELNINFLDALSPPINDASIQNTAARFLTAQAVMLSLPGVPGIYAHSLLGSRGWPEGVLDTGQNRTINRQKFSMNTLLQEIDQPGSFRSRVFHGFLTLIKIRRGLTAFHPNARLEILPLSRQVFSLIRIPQQGAPVLCLHNFSAITQKVSISSNMLPSRAESWQDLIGSQTHLCSNELTLPLEGHQSMWLVPRKNIIKG